MSDSYLRVQDQTVQYVGRWAHFAPGAGKSLTESSPARKSLGRAINPVHWGLRGAGDVLREIRESSTISEQFFLEKLLHKVYVRAKEELQCSGGTA